MKRGGPLKRHKPLISNGSLRSGPSASGGDKKRKSTGKHVGEAKAKRLAKARSEGLCETRILGVCLTYCSDFHHRLFQSQGGKWDIRNGLRVCRTCHGVITNPNGRRAEFERLGWIVPSCQDPARIPARIWHEDRCDWFFLLDDGSVQLAPWPERDERHPDELEVPRVDPRLDGAA